MLFNSWAADAVFFGVRAAVWARGYRAKDPPGTNTGPLARCVVATMLTAVFGLLPAVIAAALVGGTLA